MPPLHSDSTPARVLALGPVLLSLVWLPLRGGGSDPGPLLVSQAVTFGALAVLAATGRLRATRVPNRPLLWAMTGLVAAAGLSAAFSLDLDASVPAFFVWAWLGATAVLVTVAVRRSRDVALLAGALVAAVLLQTFWSFFVWWGGGDAGPLQSGTFYAPNQYAGYLVLLAPLLLAHALLVPHRRQAAAWGVMAAFVYLGILLSGSRAGLGAALIGAVAAAALAGRRGVRRALVRAPLVAATTALLGLALTGSLLFPEEATPSASGSPPGLTASVESKGGTGGASIAMRANWVEGAMTIGFARPLTGSGLGTFGEMFVQVQDPRWYWSRYAHNHYAEAFAEGGLPLAAATVGFPLIALVVGLRGIWRSGSTSPWQVGLFAGLLGASAHLLLDHDWSFPGYGVTFVACALLLASLPGEDSPGSPAVTTAGRLGTLALAAASALLAAAVGGLWLSPRLAADPAGVVAAGVSRGDLATWLAPYSTLPGRELARDLGAQRGREEVEAAARHLRRAIALDELEPRLRWSLGSVLGALGDLEGARHSYREAIRIAPNAPASYGLAAEFEITTAGDPKAAARILDSGIARLKLRPLRDRLAPSIAELLLLRATVEERVAGTGAALPFAAEAAEIAPGLHAPWLGLAQLRCRSGDAEAARKAADEAVARGAPASQLAEVTALIAGGC